MKFLLFCYRKIRPYPYIYIYIYIYYFDDGEYGETGEMSLHVLQCIGFDNTDFIHIVFVSDVLLGVKAYYGKKFRLAVSTVLV